MHLVQEPNRMVDSGSLRSSLTESQRAADDRQDHFAFVKASQRETKSHAASTAFNALTSGHGVEFGAIINETDSETSVSEQEAGVGDDDDAYFGMDSVCNHVKNSVMAKIGQQKGLNVNAKEFVMMRSNRLSQSTK